MLNKSIQLGSIAIAALLSSSIFAKSASALNFNFSFDDNGNNISGTIFDLTDDSTGGASKVSLSTPSNLDFSSPTANSFTVAGGAITDATYSSNTNPNLQFFAGAGFKLGSYRNPSSPNYTPVNFTQAAATPVPFGVSPDIGILILSGMFGVSRLRNKIAARKPINSNQAA